MKIDMKTAAGAALMLVLAVPMMATAAPFDWEILHRDMGDSSDVTTNISPVTDDGLYQIPAFLGGGDGHGSYHFLTAGSGIGMTSGNIYATIDTIETPQGHLRDTLNGLVSTSTLSSVLSILSIPPAFSVTAFMSNQASTTPLVATSTFNGFMSGAMASKLSLIATTTGISYEGTAQRQNSFPVFKSATVSSGTAVFNFTSDGTSGGSALFPNGVIQDSVSLTVNDATASYQMGYAFSNGNKTLTVTTNKLSTANILTGILGQAAGNGAVVKVGVWGY